jgi:bidirectional [NiFe] hydrogenase diaphorase subunit
VEVVGAPKLLCACSTHVVEGMQVLTNTVVLHRYRRMILEMLFAERNHVCSVCVSNGHCDLQDLAKECGVDHLRVPYRNASYGVDSSHDLFSVDHNRCVLCTRCVRVCDEVEAAHTWDVMGRGIDSLVVTDLHRPWGESESCTSCGKCVQVCPTGALVHRGMATGEMQKNREFLPYLWHMKGAR